MTVFNNATEEQMNASNHIDGPALVLAVPGSGKTTTLLNRNSNLIINHAANPSRILNLTFSKNAATEMKNRFKEDYNINSSPVFSTIHRFCFNIVKLKYKNPTIVDTGNIRKYMILKDLYREIFNSYPSDEFIEESINNFSVIKNLMLTSIDIEMKFKNHSKITKLLDAYEGYKIKNNLIDFDDMLHIAYQMLMDNPKLLDHIRKTYDYIQVDEAQDNSKIQFEILKLISYPKNNIMMFADDDQSIYGFRGAYVEGLNNFVKTYKETLTFRLSINFRSDNKICEMLEELICNNKSRFPKKIYSNINGNHDMTIKTFELESELAEYLNEYLKELDGSTAILYRNNISGYHPAIKLINNNVEFELKDQKMSFKKNWIVRDILNILEFTLFQNDFDLFKKIYFKVNGYISKKQMNDLALNLTGSNVLLDLMNLRSTNNYHEKNMKKLIDNLYDLSKASESRLLEIILHDLGYFSYLESSFERYGYSKELCLKVLETLEEIALLSDSCLSFIDNINTLSKKITENKNSSNVRLSTIHSVKGMEFDNVILLDLDDGIFPSTMDSPETIEEERRLFYVALSRARKNIAILKTQFRVGSYIKPSSFIKEVKPHFDDNTKDYDDLMNKQVAHSKFGIGKVVYDKKDVLKIDFSEESKEFAKSICLDNGLIRIIE